MERKTTWVVPPTISLSFSGTLAPPLTRNRITRAPSSTWLIPSRDPSVRFYHPGPSPRLSPPRPQHGGRSRRIGRDRRPGAPSRSFGPMSPRSRGTEASARSSRCCSRGTDTTVAPIGRAGRTAKLLKADLAFLDCLEKTRTTTERGGVSAAVMYRTMCIMGLRNIIIPYRMHLVKLQSGPSIMEVFNNLISKVTYSSNIRAEKRKDML
ncbi:hypothetical protein OPV22_030042 [Ensete ventricosum]|uniref:Uncharacterized protein n=1 Tax=Ensete ventricosum TaxID=4639 RepID=A0AAV8PZ62_ENSVE|nr:hypothetical protein OPV22_030042 [Ensete ventricosum]